MVEFEDLETNRFELKDNIKLTKNSKGYNWEIRLLNTDINKLKELNIQMMKEFGSLND